MTSSPWDPAWIAAHLLEGGLLVLGDSGRGKSTLVMATARASLDQGRGLDVISADPGLPSLGPPAALCRQRRDPGGAAAPMVEALCTLDAGRYRAPLLRGVGRLTRGAAGPLLVDGPGLSRGLAATETALGLVDASGVRTVLVLARPGDPLDAAQELRAYGVRVEVFAAAPAAAPLPKAARRLARTRLWEAWLDGAESHVLTGLPLAGSPPPREVPEAWPGRVVALLGEGGHTLAMGEVVAFGSERLRVRVSAVDPALVRAVLLRDAARDRRGLLATAPRHAPQPQPLTSDATAHARDPISPGHPPDRAAAFAATVLGGLFGDPLLHLRHDQAQRSLLLDLGDTEGIPTRLAHQVSDVFVSHAHLDHWSGFGWLLRRRLGTEATCRLVGPPGMTERLGSHVAGALWDRIGDEGPRFEVGEFDGESVRWTALQVGHPPVPLRVDAAPDGVLRRERGFLVRAAVLDHGTPVLAFALEEADRLAVRTDSLLRSGLPPGPWVGLLKDLAIDGRLDEPVRLPSGSLVPAGRLAAELLARTRGRKLAYAVDLADHADNRRRLVALAEGADTLVCEASFAEEHRERARVTSHLTARACGEIAREAGVGRLVPFHLSNRYQWAPERVLAEVQEVFDRLVIPEPLRGRLPGPRAT